MAKLSFALISAFFFIILVISGTSEAIVFKRCHQVLHKTRCNLANCRRECFFKFRSYRGFGQCLGKSPYKCVCFYDCLAKNSEAVGAPSPM
ncbi:hypothetical protein AAZX31_06G227300 [Glycine max]|nr:hypothetical protein GLYMA_06G244650v4 [Glycine max]KAG5032793.1 hypothetical protein JHK85_016775 [Glycine max]KAG5047003.1 hypothetical protein JHK86_016409 [Glycine max]KAG5149481.1 hypothetical protein JHK82_016362 [Glycine max]KAH1127439.1 hypothetical protein GYH30_016150 [Glycine max]